MVIFQATCEKTENKSRKTCPCQCAIMLLKATKYQQFDAASGRLRAHLEAPGGRPAPPAQSRCTIKAERIGQFSGNGTKITKNTNMPLCQYAFKTNEISIICCPSGPLKGAPRPPRASGCIMKPERIGHVSGNA